MENLNYILSEQDPDGRTGQVNELPIAIFHGESTQEAEDCIPRIIAKYLAKGKASLQAEKEALVAEVKDSIREIIAENGSGTILVDESIISIAPIAIADEEIANLSDSHFRGFEVSFDYINSKHLTASQLTEETDHNETKFYELVEAATIDKLFVFQTPFFIAYNDIYGIEKGILHGPYRKIDNNGGYYLVYSATEDKGGVVSPIGSIIADCIYDHAYNQCGYAVLVKDNKMGFYTPYDDILVPCEYEDLEFPDESYEPVIAIKDGERGLVATDGSFHPFTDEEEPDESLTYL